MDDEEPRAMGYVCIDLVKTVTGLDIQTRKVATRLGYEYAGLCRNSSLIMAEALLDHVSAHRIELLIVPGLMHLRGRIPADLADLTDIHDLVANRTYEREGAYAPDEGHSPSPLAAP
ncbi:hypothetical protein NONO_c33340 [Nocardia nova SH22a]|uniref:Uncharacterized protein n=1 Tax=Nocardia nova SH22a TaxID=1415166 RepID=W5TLL3_9NOCA|nr:hypothetical protein [Nocardia nova]AHH18121.1 hypothetical protein NONO_c33340 [Nocardia nova SH22a]